MADIIDTPEPQKPEASPVEQKAMEQGWVPQDQWDGSPDDWRPAKEFVDRGELLEKISQVKRENSRLKEAFEEFGKHHSRVKQIEYERAIQTLKVQKRDALADNDADAVINIDDKIDALKQSRNQEQVPVVRNDPQPDPMFQNWIARNQWYVNDPDMKAVADDAGRRAAQAGTVDKAAIIETVDKAIRRAFPHKFNNPKRDAPGAVEGSTNKATTRQADPASGMTGTERRIMETVLKSTGMSREQYLKEYKDVKVRGV